jgi:excisionase family DNA binding protein
LLPEPAAGAGLEPEQLLTVQQVAELMGVCRATVYRLRAGDHLQHVRVLNSIRIRAQDVQNYLGRNR